MGRLIALSIVAAAVYLQTISALPDRLMLFGLSAMSVLWVAILFILFRLCPHRWSALIARISVLLCAFILSLTWSSWRAELRLNDRLSVEQENVVSRVTFLVNGLVQDQGDSLRFEAIVQTEAKKDLILSGIPRHIQVVWRKSLPEQQALEVRPGQQWRAALIFKRPRSALNPHGFDYEAHLLSRNIRAIGRVRGRPVLVSEDAFHSMQVIVSLARQKLRGAMRRHVGDMTYGAVLIALAIGDQDSVRTEHWNIFNKTGITHLVSISGSHVTMLAAFGGLSMLWLWKRLRWRERALGEYVPAKVMAALAALAVAWLYCLLAGWGVPARRTFFMLLVSGLAMMARLPIKATGILCLAAAVVTVIDPWSPISSGFWLSFGAVAILFFVGSQAQSIQTESVSLRIRIWQLLRESARLQWLITLAMLPSLAFLFQQVSISSPLANAVAIPVVTFIVTPFALLTALISCVPGMSALASMTAWIAHVAFDGCMIPVSWLAHASWSSFAVAAMPLWSLMLSVLGLCWALQPPGVPLRWVGWTLLLPALSYQPQRIPDGGWWLSALDVGQGSAILVKTRHHALLFDTGPKVGPSDAGQRVVAPVMRAMAVRKLDTVVISHSDMDHAGGLPGLLKEISVEQVFSSFNLERWLSKIPQTLSMDASQPRPNRMSSCVAGHFWDWDGVRFSFLHPQDESSEMLENQHPTQLKQKVRTNKIPTNTQSCVLHIHGVHHSALLTGDIGIKQEEEILQRLNTTLSSSTDLTLKNNSRRSFADVVLVGHHGSLTSSSQSFIRFAGASHAIAQAGYLNRFSHPALEVQQRWLSARTHFWRTDLHGAVTVLSSLEGLNVQPESMRRKRYWHERDETLLKENIKLF
jgi:competence protein ComEC